MVNSPRPAQGTLEQLSSLMDGALPAPEARRLVGAWRDDTQIPRVWRDYHLIGDVMRSEDLALCPQRDQVFLAALRDRLSQEPVPLAPRALAGGDSHTATLGATAGAAATPPHAAPASGPGARRARFRLVAPMAVAAGFVAVAGVMVVLRSAPGPGATGPQMAAAPATVAVQVSGVQVSGVQVSGMQVSGVKVLRDTRLDRYLSAHRKQANGFDAPGAASQQVQVVYERE